MDRKRTKGPVPASPDGRGNAPGRVDGAKAAAELPSGGLSPATGPCPMRGARANPEGIVAARPSGFAPHPLGVFGALAVDSDPGITDCRSRPAPEPDLADEHVFTQFFQRHDRRLRRFFTTNRLSVEDAEDLCGETFLVLWLRRKEVKNPKAFLNGAARRLLKAYYRDRRRLPTVSIDALPLEQQDIPTAPHPIGMLGPLTVHNDPGTTDPPSRPVPASGNGAMFQAPSPERLPVPISGPPESADPRQPSAPAPSRDLRRLLSLLTPRQRQVIELIYLKGYTCKATAEELGISAITVRRHQQKAFDRLRKGKKATE